jgi:hypothetical protein
VEKVRLPSRVPRRDSHRRCGAFIATGTGDLPFGQRSLQAYSKTRAVSPKVDDCVIELPSWYFVSLVVCDLEFLYGWTGKSFNHEGHEGTRRRATNKSHQQEQEFLRDTSWPLWFAIWSFSMDGQARALTTKGTKVHEGKQPTKATNKRPLTKAGMPSWYFVSFVVDGFSAAWSGPASGRRLAGCV